MGQFLYLTEARIRDFNRRKEAGEHISSPEPVEGKSLESMLFDEIVQLRGMLQATDTEADADDLRQRIQALETQLLVSLESTGRPLLARVMSEKLQRLAQGALTAPSATTGSRKRRS